MIPAKARWHTVPCSLGDRHLCHSFSEYFTSDSVWKASYLPNQNECFSWISSISLSFSHQTELALYNQVSHTRTSFIVSAVMLPERHPKFFNKIDQAEGCPDYSILLGRSTKISFLKDSILVEKMNEKSFLIKRISFCVSVQSRLEYFLLCKTLWCAVHRNVGPVLSA